MAAQLAQVGLGAADLDVHVAAVRAKSVVRAQIVLRQVTAARPNLSDLPRAASVDRDSRADAETVASCLLELNGHPVMPRSLPVIQHRGHIIHVADHHIEIAVVVEIADRESPTRLGDLQSGARGLRDVDEPACVVQEELILLAEAFMQRRIVIDIWIDVPIGEEEVETAVQIGVEKRRAPSHAREGWTRQTEGSGQILEQVPVAIVIERVAVVREVGDDEIESAVTIVIA